MTGEIYLTSIKREYQRKPNDPTIGIRGRRDLLFVKKVMRSTCFIKNGVNSGADIPTAIKNFSGQSAKAVKFSDYSFPTFVIRQIDQRNSYSKGDEGVRNSLKTPTKATI